MRFFNKRMLIRIQRYNNGHKINRIYKNIRCKILDDEIIDKIQSNIRIAIYLFRKYSFRKYLFHRR